MTTQDVLFISLALGFVVIAFFLAMALYAMTKVFRNLQKVSQDVADHWQEWSESINTFSQIVSIVNKIGAPVIKFAQWGAKLKDIFGDKFGEFKEKRRSKKSVKVNEEAEEEG